jgi:RimJ/RimL family protein N-acetyltransferase
MASRVILETSRLLLHELGEDDFDDLFAMFSDPEVMRYYPATKSADETRAWLNWNLDSYDAHGHGLWAAVVRDSGDFAGQVGLVRQEVNGTEEIELGYLLVRRHWGQGLATEAGRACLDYARDRLGCRRVVSLIDPRNEPSCRVAARLGMQREREVVKWDKPIEVYAVPLDES